MKWGLVVEVGDSGGVLMVDEEEDEWLWELRGEGERDFLEGERLGEGLEGEEDLRMSLTERTFGFRRRSMPNLISWDFGKEEEREDLKGGGLGLNRRRSEVGDSSAMEEEVEEDEEEEEEEREVTFIVICLEDGEEEETEMEGWLEEEEE